MTELPAYAFNGSPALEEIHLPETLTKVSGNMLSNCGSLTAIALPEAVTSIGSYAFSGCSSLCEVLLSDALTAIGIYAFSECSSLESIEIPDTVTNIGGRAFQNCTSLSSVKLPLSWKTVDSYGSNTWGNPYYEGPFVGCSSLKSVTVPEGMTELPAYAFYGSPALMSVQLPDTIVSIGNSAFGGCTSMNVLVISDRVDNIGKNAFTNCPNLTIHCSYNSYATIYAIENSVPFSPSGEFEDNETYALDRKESKYYADLNGMSANGYVRMKLSYAIKENHTATVEAKELNIVLPENCTLDEMTLKLNGALCTNYNYDGKRMLKIPLLDHVGEIQFYIAMSGQNLYSYAALSVIEGGESRREIIGIVNETAAILTLNAPESIGSDSFAIDGIAPSSSSVNILVDGEVQSSVTASKAGNWSATVVLESPENYRDYFITAQCMSDGAAVEQSVAVVYRMGEPEITGFIMSYNEHNVIKECDLLNSNGIKPVVYFLPGTQFDFQVTFTNPEAVDKVYITSTRNQEKKYLEATYNEETGTFVTDGYFDEHNDDYVPGKMAVEYTKKHEMVEVSNQYDWSFFDGLTQNLPDDAVKLDMVTETDILADINLGSISEDLKDVVVKTGISIYDEATDGNLNEWLGVFESYETMAGYIIPGVDDKKYIAYFDTSDPKAYLMLVKDLTDNSFFKLALEGFVDDGQDDVFDPQEAYNLIEVSTTLSTVNKASSLLLKQLEIEENMDALREEIMTTTYATPGDRENALRMVDALEKDQKYFSLVTTALPMVVAAAGLTVFGATMGAPAILFTAILGFYSTMAPVCWQLRTNMIKSPSYVAKFAIDPSGYVYDANTMECLEGVQVTAYCILFDDSEDFWESAPTEGDYGTKWDASEYNQENSLYTNADGKYAWDVPEGWWRVKCEKEGYITTWSDWLPVPPPQTEVNIGMEPKPHSFTNYISDGNATCTQDGTKTAKCDHCDVTDTIVDVGSALGHSFGEWAVITEPTTTEDGLEERCCTRCGHTEQRTIAKLENPFNDVAPGSFYYEPVMWAIENGITNGTSATTFGPNDQCMRAHVVTFLWRAVGSPEPTRTDNPFVDVKPGDFYYKPVLWAVENGITSGMDATHFGPTAYCNRAQVVTFLYRTMGNPDVGAASNPFTDVAVGSFYEKPVLWAVENGVTAGMSATSFGPNSICNRAQIVTFLYRAFVD